MMQSKRLLSYMKNKQMTSGNHYLTKTNSRRSIQSANAYIREKIGRAHV